jgi:Fe-S-cluster containining protein
MYMLENSWDEKGDLILRCPALKDDNTCDIYNFRPNICRVYGTIDELPCVKLHPKASAMLHYNRVQRIIARAIERKV